MEVLGLVLYLIGSLSVVLSIFFIVGHESMETKRKKMLGLFIAKAISEGVCPIEGGGVRCSSCSQPERITCWVATTHVSRLPIEEALEKLSVVEGNWRILIDP